MTLVHQDTATREECARALRQLSDRDLGTLDELARLRAVGLTSLSARDLLHEAIVRMLDGRRKWLRDVPLIAFLRGVMRSIASDQWRRQEAAVVVSESAIGTEDETADGAIAEAPDASLAPETRAAAAQTLSRIEELFKSDAEALTVLAGMATGLSPRDIQEENVMSKTRYASTQRRIRRKLARAFPNRPEGA